MTVMLVQAWHLNCLIENGTRCWKVGGAYGEVQSQLQASSRVPDENLKGLCLITQDFPGRSLGTSLSPEIQTPGSFYLNHKGVRDVS